MGEDTSIDRLKKTIRGSALADPQSGCWVWHRQVSNSGYGKMMVREDGATRYVSAHRASYRAFVEPLADDQVVRQTCGNRLCVNPDHLELLPPQIPSK